jgi:hypothetical protein
MTWYPEPSFAHVQRLSDDTGLFEHARGAVPVRASGYCVDDVARGLMVICREPRPAANVILLGERYLAFLGHAATSDGTFHNRLGFDRQWHDAPGTGDWWGRAIWGLGTAVSSAPIRRMRHDAYACFEHAAHQRSRWPRAMAFAGLGAAEVLSIEPEHDQARRLLADAVTTVGPPPNESAWPWPEPRLTYANAVLADVYLAAAQYLHDPRAGEIGLRMLTWLVEIETHDGHLSTTPVGGWGPGEPRPGFDQQPIEAATLADACARALALTGDRSWVEPLCLALGWFLGDNDTKTELLDQETGGCSDGLGATGSNLNQGAESTLALVSTLQHGRRHIPRQPHGQ